MAIRAVVGFVGTIILSLEGLSLGGTSFAHLCRISPLLVIAAIIVGLVLAQDTRPPTLPPTPSQSAVPPLLLPLLLLGGAVAMLAVPADRLSWILAWIAAVAGAAMLTRNAPFSPTVCVPPPGRWEVAAILTVMAGGMACILALARPDADDAYYLNAIAAALDHPDLAPLSFDGLHGDVRAPLHHPANVTEVGLSATALVAWAGNWDHRFVYYLGVPTFWAAFAPLVHWAFARTFLGHAAGIAVVLCFVFLLAWGDTHRAYGNFAYLRLFQGKAVLALVGVPLAMLATWDLVRRPDWRSCTTLTLSFAIFLGLSTTGMIITPLAAGVGLVAELPDAGRKRRAAVLFAAALGVPLIAAIVTQMQVNAAFGGSGTMPSVGGYLPMEEVVGYGWRGRCGLFFLVMLPLAFSHRAPSWGRPARYTLAALVIVFNGVSAQAFAALDLPVIAWRLYWAVPLPLVSAIAVVAAFQPGRSPAGVTVPMLAGVAALVILVAGPWTLASGNGTELRWLGLKTIAGTDPVARRIVEITPAGTSVLAPLPVAVTLAGLRQAPPQIVVRVFYVVNLERHFGAEETERRRRLAQFVNGEVTGPKLVAWALEQLRCCDIGVLVLDEGHRDRAEIATALEAERWKREVIDGRYLWRRPTVH